MPTILRITTVSISIEKLLHGQVEYFNNLGYNVHTASYGEYQYPNHHIINQLRRQISPFRDVLALLQLVRLIRILRPDIVHTHTPKAGLLGILAAKMCRVPIRVHTVAGLPLMAKSGLLKRLLVNIEKLTYAAATDILPNSNTLATYIRESIYDHPKLKVLANGTSNGIDTDYYASDVFPSSQIKNLKVDLGLNRIVFLFVGRVVSDKGINEAVSAFKKINSKYEDTSFLIVGDEEKELDPLYSFTQKELSDNKDIVSLRYQTDIRPYVLASDILLFPSHREGFPNVPLQCGAMGRALILSDINGCNEIVANQKNGILVPVADQNAICDAMEDLYLNEAKRNTFATAIRSTISQKYKQAYVWESLSDFYSNKLENDV